ncbi:unnamed protein product [Cylicostephanus goldi]|uniref:DNA2/NAM7 helicase-like C-terminal domain-containing protein n=1 Tax=Cylicostephanus goldi TaxID=71465 RepID=A0A3P6R3U5_CYLGO|nr:unnamed protein product [Cylicostephanus goldi]
MDASYYVPAAVRLGKIGVAAEPAYEIVSRMDLFGPIRDGSPAHPTPATCSLRPENRVQPLPSDAHSVMIKDAHITLAPDQLRAIELGCSNYSIVGIQAAYGTGKTVVGALIASRLALVNNRKIVVTAATNTAVAQFARTLLSFTELPRLNVVRFLSDAAAAEERDPLPVDLDNVLKRLGVDFDASLGPQAKAICRRFREGRERLERYRDRMDEEFTDEEREDYIMAEKDVSRTISDMVALMFIHRPPHAPSRSYFNSTETELCQTIVTRLLNRHISPDAISILSFYKEQMRRLTDFAHENHIELATVDSIQGREKEIVILLTTRTNFQPSSGDFLNDQNRMNVALTRCRQGLFVLGHVNSLRRTSFWNMVLAWAEERRAVIPASQLDIYLPAR